MKSNLKKPMGALALAMSILLVSWQSITPLSTAFAAGFANEQTAITAEAEQAASDGVEGDAAQAADAADAADAQSQQGATETVSTAEASTAAAAASASQQSDDAANDATAKAASAAPANAEASQQSVSNGIAVQSSEYNPNADPIAIDKNVTVGLYKQRSADGTLSDPLTSTDEVTSSQTLYGQVEVDFVDSERPTKEHPNVSYTFPSNISIKAQTLDLLDESGNVAGKTVIDENGVVTLKYNEDYFTGEVQSAKFKFSFDMSVSPKGDNGQESISFPGTGATVVVKTKDGGVSGDKKAASNYDAETGTYSWVIKVSPESYATNLVVTDTLDGNLSFVDGSFKLGHAEDGSDGTPISATVNPNNAQEASISLGNLEKGDYYITYQTKVKQSALEGLNNNDWLQNIGNQAKFTWGADANRSNNSWDSGKRYPRSVQYHMVDKWTSWPSSPSAIKWVVKLNSGSLKADMGGYVFTDQAGENQKFLVDGDHPFTITKGGENGTPVDSSSATLTEDGASFTFPSEAGEDEYYITYYTKMVNADSEEQVTNTAKVTSPDKSHGPDGEATGTYYPPSKVYISKKFTGSKSQIDNNEYDGKASWVSTVKLGEMPSDTAASSIVFTDRFTNLPDGVTVQLDGNVVVKSNDGELVQGEDYELVAADSAQSKGGQLFSIVFKDSAKVKSLIGAQDKGDVTISYATVSSQKDGAYPEGEYKNQSQVEVGDVVKTAEAHYNVVKKEEPKPTVVPAVTKAGSNATWDAEYQWADGSTGAWISDWTVWVNRNANANNDSWSWSPAEDLQGNPVTVTDTLPAGSECVKNSSETDSVLKNPRYYIATREGDWGHSQFAPATVSADGDKVIFEMPTSNMRHDQWNAFTETKVYVVLTYQTASKQSLGTSDANGVEITNKAEADCNGTHFDEGSATSKIDGRVLSKDGEQDDSLVKYTIRVNENGLDLDANSDTLKLVDTMDCNCTYAGALTVTKLDGTSIEGSWSKQFENVTNNDGSTSTRMTLTLPDSTPLLITYKVKPLGELGSEAQLTNVCNLEGVTQTGAQSMKSFRVIEGSSETQSTMYGISIAKYNATVDAKLSGAEFELRSVTFGEDGKPVFKTEQTGVTGENGMVEFGTKDSPLSSNTLFCFVETKAPEGYTISNPDPVYFVLKGSDAESYERVVAEAKTHGVSPATNQTSFVVYDEKAPETPGGDKPGDGGHGGDNPGGNTPGGDNPGGDNPGGDGGNTPGDGDHGGDNPGGDNPGGDKPGTDTPGGNTPGGDKPGTDTPGTDTPGGDKPGTDTPGTDTPGTDNPGGDNPGGDNPGTDTPGGDTPGGDNPGGNVPGTDTPGTDTPGGDTPGTDTPGTDTPGDGDHGGDTPSGDHDGENPGGNTPDDGDHDGDTPGSETPGNDTPGSDTPGSDVPHDGGTPSDGSSSSDSPKGQSLFVRTSDPAMLAFQTTAGVAAAAACVIAAISLRRLRLRGQNK